MKKYQILTIIFLILKPLAFAKNTVDDTAVLIRPSTTPAATATVALPTATLDIPDDEILHSRTLIRPDQKITIQEVEPQKLEPLPPSPQPRELSIEEKNARAASTKPRRVSMLSCTVHRDDTTRVTRTHIKWTSQGKTPVEFYEAWSNIDFRNITQINTFTKENTIHNVMFGIGIEHSAKAAELARRFGRAYTPPQIPNLPNKSAANPTYIVISGNPSHEDLCVIEGIHELYKKHSKEFIAESKRIVEENARRAALLKANPPDPTPDLVIRYWIPEQPICPDIDAQPQTTEGGDQ